MSLVAPEYNEEDPADAVLGSLRRTSMPRAF